jgi:fatty acid desaturase
MSDVLTRDEITELKRASDLRGAASVAITWAMIAGAFAAAALVPHPLTWLLAVVVLGGRQLALAVLMHEAAHRSLFRTRWLNDAVGHWLCGAPMWTHLVPYRRHHLQHHSYTNSDRDPDLGLIEPFPTTPRSLARKLLRDVLGLSGLRRVIGLLLIDLGLFTYTASVGAKRRHGRSLGDVVRSGAHNLGPVILTNALMLLALVALGHGLLYLLWVASYLTTFSLFLRVRALAEHACTERTSDPFRNTRSTRAGWLARLTVAPHQVNYHLEHHLLMTVPHYNLPRMQRLLRARGVEQELPSYREVLRTVSAA